MIVFECFDCDFVTLEVDASLFQAAQLMRKFHVSYVVVVENKGMQCIPLGIVTDKDIVIKAISTELDPEVITIGDIMISPLHMVSHEADLENALDIMVTQGVRHLPVIDQAGRLLGVLNVDDLLVKITALLSRFTSLITNENVNELNHHR